MTGSRRSTNTLLAVTFGTALLVLFGLALIASLVNLWPVLEGQLAAGKGAGPPATVRLLLGALTVHVGAGSALLLLVVIAGALGSLVHVATSFADFVGNRRFYLSWSAWYLLRPLLGASLALLLYFAVRAGFLSSGAQNTSVNPYGTAALAGLAGLFSKQATDKLREVFETLFKVSSAAGDAQRRDDLANPVRVPLLTAVDPDQIAAGSPGATLRLHGAHFIEGVTVARVNATDVSTKVLSGTQLEVDVDGRSLLVPAVLIITVHTSAPGGGDSRAIAVTVA